MTTQKTTHKNSSENGLLALDQVVKHFDISGGLLDQLRLEKAESPASAPR
jgi:hypothetical protein